MRICKEKFNQGDLVKVVKEPFLDKNNFIGDSLLIISDLICVVCNGVAYKPYKDKCGHLFCLNCLKNTDTNSSTNKNNKNTNHTSKGLYCPINKIYNVSISTDNVDYQSGLFSIINQLEIKCKNYFKCNWSGTVLNYPRHLDLCMALYLKNVEEELIDNTNFDNKSEDEEDEDEEYEDISEGKNHEVVNKNERNERKKKDINNINIDNNKNSKEVNEQKTLFDFASFSGDWDCMTASISKGDAIKLNKVQPIIPKPIELRVDKERVITFKNQSEMSDKKQIFKLIKQEQDAEENNKNTILTTKQLFKIIKQEHEQELESKEKNLTIKNNLNNINNQTKSIENTNNINNNINQTKIKDNVMFQKPKIIQNNNTMNNNNKTDFIQNNTSQNKSNSNPNNILNNNHVISSMRDSTLNNEIKCLYYDLGCNTILKNKNDKEHYITNIDFHDKLYLSFLNINDTNLSNKITTAINKISTLEKRLIVEISTRKERKEKLLLKKSLLLLTEHKSKLPYNKINDNSNSNINNSNSNVFNHISNNNYSINNLQNSKVNLANNSK